MIALALATLTVAGMIVFGIFAPKMSREKALRVFKSMLGGSAILIIISIVLLFSPSTALAESQQVKEVNGNAMIGVALSTGLAALGAGIAVGMTGSAAIGAISEDPKMLGRSLIFVGLAEGIAIYGLVISIMIFGRV